MTDYLRLAQERVIPLQEEEDNPYLPIAREASESRHALTRTVLESAMKANPEQAAEQQRLAKTSGLPLRVVERNLADVKAKEQARAIDLITMAGKSPVLARQLTDPTFTSVAVDDLSVLSQLEQSIGRTVRYMMGAGPAGGIVGDLKSSLYRSAAAVEGTKRAAMETIAPWAEFLTGNRDNWFAGMANYYGGLARANTAEAERLAPPSGGVLGGGVSAGIQSFAQNAKYLPLALLGPAGAAAGLGGMVAESFGASYQKAAEAGVPLWQRLGYASSDAMIEYWTEKLPLDKLLGGIKEGAPLWRVFLDTAKLEVPGEQIATVLQDMNEWATINPGKPFSGYLSERPSAAAQTLIATLIGTGGNVAVGAATAKALDAVAGLDWRAQDTLEWQRMFDQQLKAARESALRERSPEKFNQLLQSVVDSQASAKDLYVDGEVLAQLPTEILQNFSEEKRQEIADAAAMGSTVALPIADVLTYAPGTPLEQVVRENGRMTPDALTPTEAAEVEAIKATFAQTEGPRMLEQAQAEEVSQADFEYVRSDIEQQITQTGRYGKSASSAYATALATFFQTYGSRLGQSTRGYYDAWKGRGFAIRGKAQTAGGIVEQRGVEEPVAQTETPEFKAWFSDSKVTDSAGKPLVVYHGTDAEFSEFKTRREGAHFGTFDQASFRVSSRSDGRVLPVYLSIQNPARLPDLNTWAAGGVATELLKTKAITKDQAALVHADLDAGRGGIAAWKTLKSILAERGIDGIVYANTEEGAGDSYIAFRPEQIKSAIGNRGTFDPQDPNILKQGEQADALGTFNPRTFEIVLNPSASLASLWHEGGHFFLEALFDAASLPNAPPQMVADRDAFLKWAGIADAETWLGMTLEEKRKYHERWAESVEQYVMEGKVPNAELQPLMRRFRSWLLSLYKSIKQFVASKPDAVQMPLNDDVRRVLDRMLATDEQIEQAEQIAGMLPAEDATAAAVERLQGKSLRDFKWGAASRDAVIAKIQREAKAIRKATTEAVRAEVEELPVVQAARAIAEADKRFAEDPTSADHEAARMLIADAYGFRSVDQMVREIEDFGSVEAQVEQRAAQRMLEEHGEFVDDDAIRQAANEAVHNKLRARILAGELKAQADALNQRDETGETNARGSRVTVSLLKKAAEQFAADVIGRTKIRDLKSAAWKHTSAERRAAAKWNASTAKGKTADAIGAKRDQYLNHEAATAAMEAQAEVVKWRAYLKKFEKDAVRKALSSDYLDQIDKLMERVDLRSRATINAAERVRKRAALIDWAKTQEEVGIEVELPEIVGEENQLPAFDEMTYEEASGLVDTVKTIEHLGRLKSKLLAAKDKREFEAVVVDFVDSIEANNVKGRKAELRAPSTLLGDALAQMRHFGAAHIKSATVARILDGDQDGGVAWERLIRPANEAGDKEVSMRADATERLTKILAPWIGAGHMRRKAYYGAVNASLTREQVLAIALNMGNEGNEQRLLDGEGWTREQVDALLSTLTPEELRSVQAVWDFFESYRPQVGALEKEIFGKEPKWIERRPITVNTKGGPVVLDGGYYPVVYDTSATGKAEQFAEAETANRQKQNAYSASTVRKGFTKTRADAVRGRPLLLSLQGVYRSANDVIHYLTWQKWLIDANRLLRNDQIDSSIRKIYGPEFVRQLKTWRNAVAEGDSSMYNEADKLTGALRQSVSVAGLGFNAMSALLQPLGFINSAVRIGPEWIGKGLQRYAGGPRKATVEASAASEFMRNRFRTRFRELNELRTKIEGQSIPKRLMGEYAYWMMLRMQQVVDVPTWWGAYEKAIADGQTEERSIALADQAVIDSQGSGMRKDLAAIERGSSAAKLFTVFYSFMNVVANLSANSAMTRSKARAAVDILSMVMLAGVAQAALKNLFTPGDSDDDDDPESIAKFVIENTITSFLGLFVVAREFAEVGRVIAGDGPSSYAGPAGVRVVADSVKAAQQIKQGEFDDAFRKAMINLAGDLFGIPSAQLNRSITGAKAISEGKTSNPAAVVTGYQEQ